MIHFPREYVFTFIFGEAKAKNMKEALERCQPLYNVSARQKLAVSLCCELEQLSRLTNNSTHQHS
jgi:hypothetical protein